MLIQIGERIEQKQDFRFSQFTKMLIRSESYIAAPFCKKENMGPFRTDDLFIDGIHIA